MPPNAGWWAGDGGSGGKRTGDPDMRDAVAIMAKAPLPGLAKTRLCPPLLPEEAADLARGFLLDTIETLQAAPEIDPFIAYAPREEEAFFRSVCPPRFGLVAQPEGDLGARLARTADLLFAAGYGRVILMASDTPHLPALALREGLFRLDEADLTIGPCEDGGYYLVGMRRPAPEIFEGIPWSTETVLACTLTRARAANRTVFLLAPAYDLDRVEDLVRLQDDLARGVIRAGCRHTKRALARAGFSGVRSRPTVAP
jgi:rSAM/selenodomain-associated transferase 1